MGDGQLQITFDQVGQHNLVQLKTLNCVIFPIKYQEKVYQDILACGEVTQLAYHDGHLVGAMACRLEKSPQVYAAAVKRYISLISFDYYPT
jgi:hypothetical protein